MIHRIAIHPAADPAETLIKALGFRECSDHHAFVTAELQGKTGVTMIYLTPAQAHDLALKLNGAADWAERTDAPETAPEGAVIQ